MKFKTKLSKKTSSILGLSIVAMLFVLPSMLATSVWTNPEQLTTNGQPVETDVVVDVDENGVVHYAHNYFISESPDFTDIYYSNNSAPDLTGDTFLSDITGYAGTKIKITNRPEDNLEL